MATFEVQIQSGGNEAPWRPGGMWILNTRFDRLIEKVNATGGDGVLYGTMQYSGEAPIGFKAAYLGNSTYGVESQSGGDDVPWQPVGEWVIDYGTDQFIVEFDLNATEGEQNIMGTISNSEGPMGFRGDRID